MATSTPSRPTAGLALVRVACGLILVRSGWTALGGDGPTGSDIRDRVQAALPDLSGPLRWWGETFLLENPDAIAFLWQWLVLAVGAALVIGALSRPMGVIATVLMVNAWAYGSPEAQLLHLLLAVCCLACAISRAGRTAGLDAVLESSLPPWLTWVYESRRKNW